MIDSGRYDNLHGDETEAEIEAARMARERERTYTGITGDIHEDESRKSS